MVALLGLLMGNIRIFAEVESNLSQHNLVQGGELVSTVAHYIRQMMPPLEFESIAIRFGTLGYCNNE